mmetsp:Transcript_22656/g.31607  ORF Transcript_22656/g.31607 Transcript_22656/m.31607 type:complete len:515 (-) Transcript_22656:114-1658(-)|eukprot:CAMPEP_0196579744 /NCGR_PEP_ID=MMETSP1081-20130531/24484_1 /TAXON_ID=36882 /ORGANISM="Pyramimonas amylifera, Strain CCMP720" /LENGTH=514 /DNA_ID=CAMNT_0041899413 /DNA_START=74 /DNA_END=1618 /DNA_ORIENTATION=+
MAANICSLLINTRVPCAATASPINNAGTKIRPSFSRPVVSGNQLSRSFIGTTKRLASSSITSRVIYSRRCLATLAESSTSATQSTEIPVEQLRFLSPAVAERMRSEVGTPCFVYDLATLQASADKALAFPNAFGITVRYAMKSCPNAAILQVFHNKGVHIDASSGFEVRRALAAGIPASHISLSTQELPDFFPELVKAGVKVNACSLSQLERFGQDFPGAEVGVRFNPGMGSGGTGKTNVGGPASSFGIWHESAGEVASIVAAHSLKLVRVHTHIGSGSDPDVWQRVSSLSVNLCREFPDVTTLNLGGGYKVGRMADEKSTDLAVVGVPVKEAFESFALETGRELQLEIEPGTFLLANAGAVLATVQDVVTTGAQGHTFLKADMGMTELLRPSLYGAQHPVVVIPAGGGEVAKTSSMKYVVVGHCCESGDLVTPKPGEPESIQERPMGEAQIGDLLVMEGAGAYCSSMSTKHYNSFPEAAEVMVCGDKMTVIRNRQPYEQIWQNETALPDGFIQ